MTMIRPFLSGAIVMAAWAISFFFLRFRRSTGDQLFGFFSAAFFLLGLERVLTIFLPFKLEPLVHAIRLLAFLLILTAIWIKNHAGQKS